MSQKFNITYDTPKSITIKCNWVAHEYLKVKYNWENAPSSVTLPVDNNKYIPNDNVTVDTTYKENDIIKLDDSYLSFSGWDKEDFIITNNTTINGNWFSNDYLKVTYNWGTDALISNDLPVDNNKYIPNDNVTVDDGTDYSAVVSECSWTTKATPNTYSMVCYGNGKYVAISKGKKLAYSDDGINWTDVSLPTYESYYYITYLNGKFMITGYWETNRIVTGMSTSVDGITWSSAISFSTNLEYANNICYGNGVYLINDAKMYYIIDESKEYTTYTDYYTTYKFADICYANGKFVGVINGDSDAGTYFYYSTDGITWTAANNCTTWNSRNVYSNRCYRSICYGNGKFIAIDNGCKYLTSTESTTGSPEYYNFSSGNSKYYKYSTDGITWETGELPSERPWQSIAYGNGVYMMMSIDGMHCLYSFDGLNWVEGRVGILNETINTDIYWYIVNYDSENHRFISTNPNRFSYLPLETYIQFKSWDHTDFIITEDTTIKALWDTKNKLKVEYSWSNAPSDLISTPPDTSYYLPNSLVTVDTYYNNNCIKESTLNGDTVYYQFSGWDKENFSITKDTNINGSWGGALSQKPDGAKIIT